MGILDAINGIGRRDFCPCRSGRRLEACCLHEGMFFRPPLADVNPPGARTNHTNPGCYLSAVDDNCCTKLSREHFVSKSILEILNIAGGSRGVLAEGFPWLKEPKPLPPEALASKVLCKRHNEGLGKLDGSALAFFQCLMNVPTRLREPTDKRHEL